MSKAETLQPAIAIAMEMAPDPDPISTKWPPLVLSFCRALYSNSVSSRGG